MPKQVKALSAIEVKRLSKTGFQAVGTIPGLGLMITPQETKSWVYRVSYGGARRSQLYATYKSNIRTVAKCPAVLPISLNGIPETFVILRNMGE